MSSRLMMYRALVGPDCAVDKCRATQSSFARGSLSQPSWSCDSRDEGRVQSITEREPRSYA
jgi:hypothetical protein